MLSSAVAVTRVRGVERKGLAIEAAALHARHPEAGPAAVDQAMAMLAGVVPDSFSANSIEQLGRPAQESVARLIDRLLRLVDEEASRTAARHVARLLELLGDLAEVLKPAALNWRRKSLRQALAETRPELDRLRAVLERSEAGLVDQRDRLLAMQSELQLVFDSLQSVLITLAELKARFDDSRRQSALDQRETDVLKSLALLHTHSEQVARLEADFAQLARRIRDAVLHALPAWLSMAASMPNESLNDTERFSLMDRLQQLILGLHRP